MATKNNYIYLLIILFFIIGMGFGCFIGIEYSKQGIIDIVESINIKDINIEINETKMVDYVYKKLDVDRYTFKFNFTNFSNVSFNLSSTRLFSI